MAHDVSVGLKARQGRRFGFTVGSAFVLFALIFVWRDKQNLALAFASLGGLLLGGALVAPRLLLPVEKGWMALAHQISRITTPIVMGVVYYLVVTPIALVIRKRNGNPMAHARGESGFWYRRDSSSEGQSGMERQF